ncbi:hypothetical protein [Alkalimarinus sediminis]|uniref:Uncharacterized protein n=1 Tax=Alkalimarinus sediminis TaxID=1632866 RepID=A0A9E8HH01_9ALTE|nr:hypothetical protein [Alkalimarinus sediminis]UZW74503.1 hypothetical protein NNL22_15990 [Alkalimarinus sediminis]
MDTQVIVAIAAIVASSAFSGAALFLNYLAVKRQNRLAVASRYSEVSKTLSDETCVIADIIGFAENRFEHQTEEQKENGQEYIKEYRNRLQEIDSLQKVISNRFKHLDEDDPAEIEELILVNHSYFTSAQRTLNQIRANNA